MICHVCRLLAYHLIAGPDCWPDGMPVDRCERCVKHARMIPEEEVQKFKVWNSKPGPSIGIDSFEYFLESLGRKPEGWRALVGYPNSVKPTLTLDALEDLVPIPNSGRGRYGDLNEWLDTAEKAGLLIGREKDLIKIHVGPHM